MILLPPPGAFVLTVPELAIAQALVKRLHFFFDLLDVRTLDPHSVLSPPDDEVVWHYEIGVDHDGNLPRHIAA